MAESTKPTWAVVVNGRLWETCTSQRAGIRLWKTLAHNELFKRSRVVLYGPRGGVIREKDPKPEEQ